MKQATPCTRNRKATVRMRCKEYASVLAFCWCYKLSKLDLGLLLLLGRVSYDEQTAASLLVNLDSCLATGWVWFDGKTVISQAFPMKLCFLDLGYLIIHYSIVLYHVT